MADALVERSGRPSPMRFFCHRCNVEFEDTLQEYICPYCSSGFIEELVNDAAAGSNAGAGGTGAADYSDSVDEDLDHPIVNDLAFLMSGGRLRGVLGGAETLLQQFVLALAGGTDVRTAGPGAPFVLVGAPGDYVLGGEGLDAVVTQLLGQLEGSGPPPLPRDQIDLIENVPITDEQVGARLQCSVCWELFNREETVSKLPCSHVFHAPCIQPWLQLHATCPICRRCLLPELEVGAAAPPAPVDTSQPAPGGAQSPPALRQIVSGRTTHRSRFNERTMPGARMTPPPSSSSAAAAAVGMWGPSAEASAERDSPTLHNSAYNFDLDFD